ncbi:TPA: hypothetical protein DEO28_04405 [Candidatus Dependentiae bacterium]|nr:MAG: hypothetical protein UR14_C0002G0001 [candidate division TM6 bacterium GW2011_GWE2_31_21]KKP53798.1 MAG: hypothetical protein UR43_C0002G0001 [candidate division TM6 bacterium GW2011_GWF2_33_332]HBS47577.1 hypothetical protein [Candidatus Dependentiae bacterium]HBZ73726.1 hypothetical protein [Candidatus Dependentiae bacterium]
MKKLLFLSLFTIFFSNLNAITIRFNDTGIELSALTKDNGTKEVIIRGLLDVPLNADPLSQFYVNSTRYLFELLVDAISILHMPKGTRRGTKINKEICETQNNITTLQELKNLALSFTESITNTHSTNDFEKLNAFAASTYINKFLIEHVGFITRDGNTHIVYKEDVLSIEVLKGYIDN